jgi:hypothetical protein
MQIPLTALLMCSDPQALATVERTFEQYGIPAYFCPDSPTAENSLNRRKFDLMVLDFDLAGAETLVDFHAMDARGIPGVIIALAKDPRVLKSVLSRRVHFMLQKPVAGELMVRTLKAAYSMIVTEKRISFRQAVRIKAEASVLERSARRSLGPATVLDVSHTGLGLQTGSLVPRDATIFVDFELPEDRGPIHTIGKVIWSDGQGHLGVQFRFIAPQEMKSLRSWLGAHCPWDVELEPRSLEDMLHLAAGAGSGSIQ